MSHFPIGAFVKTISISVVPIGTWDKTFYMFLTLMALSIRFNSIIVIDLWFSGILLANSQEFTKLKRNVDNNNVPTKILVIKLILSISKSKKNSHHCLPSSSTFPLPLSTFQLHNLLLQSTVLQVICASTHQGSSLTMENKFALFSTIFFYGFICSEGTVDDINGMTCLKCGSKSTASTATKAKAAASSSATPSSASDGDGGRNVVPTATNSKAAGQVYNFIIETDVASGKEVTSVNAQKFCCLGRPFDPPRTKGTRERKRTDSTTTFLGFRRQTTGNNDQRESQMLSSLCRKVKGCDDCLPILWQGKASWTVACFMFWWISPQQTPFGTFGSQTTQHCRWYCWCTQILSAPINVTIVTQRNWLQPATAREFRSTAMDRRDKRILITLRQLFWTVCVQTVDSLSFAAMVVGTLYLSYFSVFLSWKAVCWPLS